MDLAQAQQLNDDLKVSWIPCSNCSGDGRIGKKDGEVVRDCPLCLGTGEIPIREDDGLECFDALSTLEGMKIVSNYQLRMEGR
jgi:DnaJ-class molecular chaperone